jgi:hypothetical protein
MSEPAVRCRMERLPADWTNVLAVRCRKELQLED